jgi:23S rRNA pseudouridine1911/1915/1917 synthase
VDLRLAPDPARPNRQRVTRSEEAETRDARTYWEVAEWFDGFALLRVRPETGRRHQVRAHLAAVDLPVIGDPLYKARNYGPGLLPAGAPPVERTLLHAHLLEFEHPATSERLSFTAEPPADFAALLAHLREHAPPRAPLP